MSRGGRWTRGLLLGLALGFAACQTPGLPGAPAPSVLAQILERGELRVGVSGDLPPLNMKGDDGDFRGFEIDVVRALAESMGLEVRFVEKKFAQLLPTLERGEVDLVVSGLTITPERNARVAFAGPYFISGTSMLARSREIAEARSPAELDHPERRYAALEGSTSEGYVRDRLPNATLVTTVDYESAVQLMIDGEVDALVADHLACTVSMWRNPDAGFAPVGTPFTVEPLGIALPARAPLLLNLVQNYLNTLETTGLLSRFKAKWLADGAWMSERP
ncbi:MAG: transporter substrate-binding domain-containing protein [Proteobacteria bacterium]|nr:transporter substrate-binding domain-containing protein [Pseudomonadota bacterium]